jgi:CBS domain-containing protein
VSYLDRLQGEGDADDTVARLLSSKGEVVWSVAPECSVADAIALMCEHDVGAVPVLEAGRLLGILSERDCVRRVVARRLDPSAVPVTEVMTRDVVVAWPLQQVEDCLETMNEHRIRHVPVVEKGLVVGIISLRDLAAVELDRRKALLEKLDEFVLG